MLFSTFNYTWDILYLCAVAGFKLHMDYSSNNSSSKSQANVYLDGFDYGSAMKINGFWNKPDCWTAENRNIVINNIKQGKPVQMDVSQRIWIIQLRGHSLIVDGYKSTGEFHLNMGWDGFYNTWYWLPDIDSDPSFDTIDGIVYNICPYQGWNQWGADEKNTFSTIYTAPTAENEPITHKWYVTSDSVYTFKGLVVGTGNRIYASSIPDTEGYHPSVWVINQYGETEKEITINEEIDGLTNPVQNSSGEVFVGADSGEVYRINPKDNSYDPIFPADAQLSTPPKVDSDGRIYVCTPYKLYCLSRTGYEYWEFPTPNTNYSFIRKVPAIDVERNRVYIDYYNPSTDIAYLACIDRFTGLEILSCRKYVASITSQFNSFSTPSIGPDGTVYSGCKTSLYAFNPDATLSQKWAKNLFPTYVTTSPTVGPTNTIYTSHWVDLGGGNYNLRIGARDASSGNLNWEYSQGTSNICDRIGDIYVSSNNVVSFWYISDDCSSTSTHTFYALRDNGASYDNLWDEYFGQQGGQTAFGPGATLYAISSTLAGNTIYALSDGTVGDPDGGGMGFTDNAAPAMPFNPSPIDEANNIGSTVTLSWACSDPESQAIKYSLFVGESGYDMVPVATEIISTSYQLTGLKPGTGYAWKIIATDGQAISESPTWVFATQPPPEVATPTISPDGGTYTIPVDVNISCSTSGATIHYTTNGAEPNESDPNYTIPINISSTTTLKAKAFKSGWTPSGVKSADYIITGTVATPTFSPDGGTYTSPVDVNISCSTSGATIHYTTNGDVPTESDPCYTTPINISSTKTLKAKAWKSDWTPSAVKSADYIITGTVATPTFSPDGGTFTGSTQVTLACSTSDPKTIRYTTNGTDPTSSSTLYSSPFTVSTTCTIKARGFKDGYTDSDVASASFIINPAPCKFGSFDGKKNVKLTLKDCNNNDVTFSLSGPGYGEIDCDDCDFSSITLYETIEKSVLTIKTKGKTEISIGSIIVNGSLKAILAKTTDLRGGITVTGSLGSLTFDDIADGHTITIGPSANPKAGTLMKFDQIKDLTINSEMPIKTLLATEWVGGSINAPSVGSITTKGDKKRGIAGNLFEVDLNLSQKPDTKILALGKLTVKGWIDSSRILSTGNIGTVSAGAITNSSCFAGVTDTNDLNADGVLDLPDPAVDVNYVEPATIKSITVKGIKGEQYCVINSNIAAAQILSASLSYPENNNGGIPFGLSAGFIKTLKIKDAEGTESWKNLDKPSDSKEFGDAKVLLY